MLVSGKFVSFSQEHLPSKGRRCLDCVRSLARHVLLLAAIAGALAPAACATKVAVPDVLNQDVDQARKTLESLLLKTGNITGVSGSVPTGAYVVSQTPKPGEKVSANSSVDLVAEAPVSVPDFVNSNVTDAVNRLQGVGLKVALVKRPATGIFGSPKVVQQNPSPNTPVHRDAIVTLTVSAPPSFGTLLGLVTKEPAYDKLKPEYRNALDQFFK